MPKLKALTPLEEGLDEYLVQLGKKYNSPIMRLGDRRHDAVDVISTGALTLDLALGIGGIPRGRFIELYGPPSAGKSSLCISIAHEAMRIPDRKVGYIDCEHAVDPEYAEKCGLDINEVFFTQPDSAEDALDIFIDLVRTGKFSVIFLDSIAALVPRAELDGTSGESHVGLMARLMSQHCRKMVHALAETNTTAVYTNQIRKKIGVVYGSDEATSGGEAMKFYSSIRMDMRPKEVVGGAKDESTGRMTHIKIVKNKMAPPFREADIQIDFGTGINTLASLLDAGVMAGVLQKSGGWLTFDGEKLGNGRAMHLAHLAENPEVATKITTAVYEHIRSGTRVESEIL